MDTSPTIVTWRSILIGLFLLTFNVYWVTVTEMKYHAEATALPIFAGLYSFLLSYFQLPTVEILVLDSVVAK